MKNNFILLVLGIAMIVFCVTQSSGHFILKMKGGSIDLYVLIMVFAVALIIISGILSVNMQRKIFLENGIETDAFITGFYKEKAGDSTINRAVYEFTASGGDKYKCKDAIYDRGYRVGDKLRIIYLPDNPSLNKLAYDIKGNSGYHFFNRFFLILTLFMVLFVIYININKTGFYYFEEKKQAYITDYVGEAKNVIIPDTLGKYKVAIIGGRKGDVIGYIISMVKGDTYYARYGAFQDKGLISVTIPSGVEVIERDAFKDNQLIEITIGSGVDISADAFENNFAAIYNGQWRSGGTFVYNTINRSWSKR